MIVRAPIKSQFEAYLAAETVAAQICAEGLDLDRLEFLLEATEEVKVWLESEISWREHREEELPLVPLADSL